MSASRLYHLGGTGTPVVLLHGFGADRLSWVATAPVIAPHAAVWAADLPGHGAAANAVGDGSPQAMARDLLDALGEIAEPMLMVGHSMGGAVALHLAALAPERVRGLVLIAPAGLGGAVDSAFLQGLPQLDSEEAALAMLTRLVSRARLIQPAMAAHVMAGLADPARRAALATVGQALATMPPPPWPPTRPVRLLWGEEDRINPLPEDGRFGDSLTVLPGTGHLPQVEAASKVNAAIRAALG